MQRKLNEDFIKEYSRQFSEKVTTDFFAAGEVISGKEILNLTPSRQVNFFTLKILFRKWQEEMKKLESPYFNYRNNEVRRAMVDFMNILSQHIEVGQADFRQLLQEAVEDTLILCMAPDLYLRLEFDQKEISQVNEKVTRPIHKYLKIYKEPFESFFNRHIGESHDIFLENAQSFFEAPGEEVENELELLSQIHPIQMDDLVLSEKDQVAETIAPDFEEMDEPLPAEEVEASDEPQMEDELRESEEEEGTEDSAPEEAPETDMAKGDEPEAEEEIWSEEDIEETVETKYGAQDPESTIGEEDYEPEDRIDEEVIGPVDPRNEELFVKEDEEDADEISAEEELEVEMEEKGESDKSIPVEEIDQSPSTLNDRFAERDRTTVADQLEEKKVNSIMEAISVNHRYMFTKELFDGNREEFTGAIEQIERCKSFDDAVEMLVQDFARDREWDMNSEEVKELLKVVFRKFR